MSSLDRAKKFLANKARTLALAVVPLAAATSEIQAAPLVLSTQGVNCTVTPYQAFTNSGSFCSVTSNGIGQVDGINWVSIFGNSSVMYAGGEDNYYEVSFYAQGSADQGESPSQFLPVSYDFTVGESFGNEVISWELMIALLDASSGGYTYSVSGSGTGRFTGAGIINFGSLPIMRWNASLRVGALALSNEAGFFVDIPSGSTLDLNPVSGVPEPSTWMLALTGGACLLLRRRVRRQN
jgi:hypothetical protein